MGYLVKAGLGLVLFFGAIVVFNVKLIELMEAGTCASGNTAFEIARPCPEGTVTNILLVTASIFAGLIGAGIFAFRGDPPWGRRERSTGLLGLGAFAWGLFFTSTAVAMLYTGFSNDTVGPDGELAGKIVGFTFLLMGAPVLLLALWNQVRSMGSPRDESPAGAAGPAGMGGFGGILGTMNRGSAGKAGGAAGGDAIGRIERLQKLRESGAITDAEFNKEKAKILAEQ
ncbi:MAG: SHOCT domain-containing protein [Solirubrobacterales bacterium]|nr:SHOCT domain-containing protein [Solirubrobacterales bacterium]